MKQADVYVDLKVREEADRGVEFGGKDMLSYVLSKRKHLALSTLEDSLRRIGYSLHIAPTVEG